MDKYEAEFDPNFGDKGWRRFAKDSIFTKKVHENRISRERFKETRTTTDVRSFYTAEDLDRYEEDILYDKTTGFYSNYAFQKKFKFEVKRARRYHRPLALLLLTVDGLDRIGKEYGDLCIDDCLRSVANIIRGAIRDVDIPARTEEGPIAILFPETYSSRATVCGERICKKLRAEAVNEDLKRVRITASIGIVSFPTHARDDQALYKKASEFLALAQEQGGDKVISG
jgi:diguanylate cyclase (GGDEF)-like protein